MSGSVFSASGSSALRASESRKARSRRWRGGKAQRLCFQSSRLPARSRAVGWRSRLPCPLPLSSAFISSQPAFTVPLVPETRLCHAAPVPDPPPLPRTLARQSRPTLLTQVGIRPLGGQKQIKMNGPSGSGGPRPLFWLCLEPGVATSAICPQRWRPGPAHSTPSHSTPDSSSFSKP